MTKNIEISKKDIPIDKFLKICENRIFKTLALNPKNYIEVNIVICVGKTTNAVIKIDIEENELEQKVVNRRKKL